MRDAPWALSTSITVADDWTPGIYMLKLVSTDGGSSFVPLTIRDDSSHAALLVQSSVTTWQAYNGWGGANLYTGPKFLTNTRSRVVSFDRPYDGTGSGEYFGREDLLVNQIEAMGLDVSYTTDVDTHAHPELLLNHKVFVSGARRVLEQGDARRRRGGARRRRQPHLPGSERVVPPDPARAVDRSGRIATRSTTASPAKIRSTRSIRRA